MKAIASRIDRLEGRQAAGWLGRFLESLTAAERDALRDCLRAGIAERGDDPDQQSDYVPPPADDQAMAHHLACWLEDWRTQHYAEGQCAI